ncbi:oocyte zinc finger protein XlCOF22 [Nematolebias whitei]|uniref:oocyte zinc finger protein XlCOF22 n=1 Tax=Nematolebias whitei TaxID=451745 RepID=UPI00189980B1|nr:oocyte zinc finger protein XlCOF22 [Nematolebias whitei]
MNQTTPEGSAEMSKADTLRGFVTERLSAASREILAVLETVVAAYEEEASGFKLEILRQRSELERLQPPACVGAHALQTSRKQAADEEEGGDEEVQEPVKGSDPAGPKRSPEAPCGSVSRRCGRTWTSKTQETIKLSVGVLEDPNVRVLSKNVTKKCQMIAVTCPPGLQEDKVLDLLRSSVPQLAGDKHFDILAPDQRRRLQPLPLKSLTPEEVQGTMKSTVYVRLKAQSEAQEEVQLLQMKTSICDASSEGTTQDMSRSCQELEGDSSSLQQSLEAEEDDDDDGSIQPDEGSAVPTSAGSESDDLLTRGDDEDASDSDSSWKPEGNDEEQKKRRRESKRSETIKKQRLKRLDASGDNGAAFSCKVCRAPLSSEVLLVRHAWSHEQEAGSVCGVCGESAEALAGHIQSRHRVEDCPICGESFLGALSLNEHVAAHSGEKPHSCEVCGSSFALKATLEDHHKLHDPGHRCPTCHQVFSLELQLRDHQRTHSKPRPFLCGVCGKLLCDKRSLSRHKMTHSGERPHRCQVCGRSFKLPYTLKQHEKIHTKRERSYLCDVCCKMFLSSKQLIIHMRSHTDERPYRCDECGRGFTTKGRLSMHLRVHTGESPYRCSYCGHTFKRKYNLDEHLVIHTGAKPHVCGICGKCCARKTYLTVHMRTHSGEKPYRCSLCDWAFTQSHSLKAHRKIHHAERSALN